MPGNGNGGGGVLKSSWGGGFGITGEGGTQAGTPVSTGEGGTSLRDADWGKLFPDKPEPEGPPPPRVPVIREARNVQRANIDRSSFHDPSVATLGMGAEYLQSRNATNPRPQGDTGVGAVGYDFTPSNERLY